MRNQSNKKSKIEDTLFLFLALVLGSIICSRININNLPTIFEYIASFVVIYALYMIMCFAYQLVVNKGLKK